MATKVHMEALSPTMEEGQVVKWHKAEGESVRESFRTLHRRADRFEPVSAFRFIEVEEEGPAEEVDLSALARKRPA